MHLVALTAVHHVLIGLHAPRSDLGAVGLADCSQLGAVQHIGPNAAALVTAFGMAVWYAAGQPRCDRLHVTDCM